MADNKSRETISSLTVKVDVDVSEAIAGLKALQREAKEAARALRELEGVQDISTTIVVDGKELAKSIQKHRRLDSDGWLLFETKK